MRLLLLFVSVTSAAGKDGALDGSALKKATHLASLRGWKND